ncbi:MAG: exonuclease SbcCD subunit D C-terminal domain-containing protein [Sutterellaceae bacterium]|nr:exonuclease SbcCD subunit D C-terminal domain-containing protein [Sutterellaceae bacterium]MDD7442062.1 exonuclease SbcCD subunit D C-terminal domain-containing protein [Sutterellaceae bacterium]MDY2869151.1 exonuclease SbcCD subunit D C-terminal domain-containing protein [Mesosutterella sp.]
MTRILHTSDWHLGKEIIGESTVETDEKFLGWLLRLCEERKVDCLLVSGDVFDVPMPPTRAQELYYRFLAGLVKSGCRTVVLTPGNHDSPSFLRAPGSILSQLGVVVPDPDPESEAVVVRNEEGEPVLGIAAVPFLRESEVRASLEGMTEGKRWELYEEGVRRHYASVREALGRKLTGASVPLIAMGHFFALGTKITPDPETGEIPNTVGTLGAISSDAVGEGWDYVALGHIHRAQRVKGDTVRYSGAPIPLSFREVGNPSEVILVTTDAPGAVPEVEAVPVPRFQPMERLQGDVDVILAAMERIAREQPGCWIEADYTGVTAQPDLTERFSEAADRLGVRLLAVRNQAAFRRAMEKTSASVPLEELSPEEVFRQFLSESHEDEASRKRLMGTFREALELVGHDSAKGTGEAGEALKAEAGEDK